MSPLARADAGESRAAADEAPRIFDGSEALPGGVAIFRISSDQQRLGTPSDGQPRWSWRDFARRLTLRK